MCVCVNHIAFVICIALMHLTGLIVCVYYVCVCMCEGWYFISIESKTTKIVNVNGKAKFSEL